MYESTHLFVFVCTLSLANRTCTNLFVRYVYVYEPQIKYNVRVVYSRTRTAGSLVLSAFYILEASESVISDFLPSS